ncbi:MAG: hypothetical protein ACYS4W_05495 [Planctomycetota bacterium]|jgi:hypothetical protein
MNGTKELPSILEDLHFPKIFQTFRIAIQPSKLMIAFLAVVGICLAGWIMDLTRTVVVDEKGIVTELHVYMDSADKPGAVSEFRQMWKGTGRRAGVFSTLWRFDATRFHEALKSLFAFDLTAVVASLTMCIRAALWAFKYHVAYCIIFVVIKLAMISVAGGAVCRIAALQFAKGEKPGMTEALRFSLKKFVSLFTAPLVLVAIIVFVGLFVFLLGLIANIPRVGELIMAFFMPLALMAGALIAVVLVGAVAGFNLIFPSVGYDGSDCLDAVSRSFSYVYSRPWRMVFYTALVAIYGALCYMFVRLLAFLTLTATYSLLDIGLFADADGGSKLARVWTAPAFFRLIGPNAQPALNWSEEVTLFLVYAFVLVVIGLLIAFIMSFYFSANTIIYALLRNKVDNTALEEVYTYFEQTEAELSVGESANEQVQAEPEQQPDVSGPSE